MLRLGAPLALGELGWMAMGIVDTLMAGRLGAAALGASSLGSMVVYPVAICATGMLLGMDTLVAQSHGAGDHADSRRTLANGVWLGLALSPVVALAVLGLVPVLRASGANPRVMTLLAPYLRALLWGMPGLMLYAAFRRYLQAVDFAGPVAFALVSANLVNLAGNWALMFGHWGAPSLGLEGSGLATSIARTYMAAFLLGAIVWRERRTGSRWFRACWRPAMGPLRRLVVLGLPAAGQILFEGAVFAIVTALAARLDEASLAAHSIALQVISTTYMVTLGIGSAAAVRVGHAVGRRDRAAAATAGWTALLCGAVFMAAAGVVLWARRDSPGRRAAAHCRRDGTVRRPSDGSDGRASRLGRHALAHAGAPGRLLDGRPARDVRAVLSAGMGRARYLGWPDDGDHDHRRGAGAGVGKADAGGAGGGLRGGGSGMGPKQEPFG
jgi:MATE family multidrug resistance protein